MLFDQGRQETLRYTQPTTNARYLLVSPCRNEANFIDGLIDTVQVQTVPPVLWVIVDDGSTDETLPRIEAHSAALAFLRVVRMPVGNARSFASKVHAATHGREAAKEIDYAYIGFLDADIRFGPDYYERILQAFDKDPSLGLCGGAVLNKYGDRLEYTRGGSEEYHVPGGVQFFRRECFEQIGGLTPIDGGGEDSIADVMAMMHAWKVRVLRDVCVLHLRPEGFGKANVLQRGMNWGRRFYLLGYHPLFYVAQCVRRVRNPPIILGSACSLMGFLIATWKRERRPVSQEFVVFIRKTQMYRLRETLRQYVRLLLRPWQLSQKPMTAPSFVSKHGSVDRT